MRSWAGGRGRGRSKGLGLARVIVQSDGVLRIKEVWREDTLWQPTE